MKQIILVNKLAAQIRKATPGTNRSASMKSAWKAVKKAGNAEILTFKKKSTGEVTTRIVSRNWFDFQPPVGGQSTNKATQIIFADLCKYATGCPCIISTFPEQIIPQTA